MKGTMRLGKRVVMAMSVFVLAIVMIVVMVMVVSAAVGPVR